MKNELDIVEQLLGNEDIAECHKPRASKKKAIRANLDKDTPPEDLDVEAALEPHVKHLDPPVKGRDATSERKDKEHWIGDCHKLSKEEKEFAGLPPEAYLVIKRIHSVNASACVYDPIHWMYGWGDDTLSAVKDLLGGIKEWRETHTPEEIAELTRGWEERLTKYGNPYNFKVEEGGHSNKHQKKNLDTSTNDILKTIGL